MEGHWVPGENTSISVASEVLEYKFSIFFILRKNAIYSSNIYVNQCQLMSTEIMSMQEKLIVPHYFAVIIDYHVLCKSGQK